MTTHPDPLRLGPTSTGFSKILNSDLIFAGWGRTENGKLPDVLLRVNLKVSDDQKAGFLTVFGNAEEYGICKVI